MWEPGEAGHYGFKGGGGGRWVKSKPAETSLL